MKAASGLATVIGIIKWGLMAFVFIGGVVWFISAMQPGFTTNAITGNVEAKEVSDTLVSLIVFSTVSSVLFIFVVFGWFQHSLHMLVNIVANTRPDAYRSGYNPVTVIPPMPQPGTRQTPQQWTPAPPANTP